MKTGKVSQAVLDRSVLRPLRRAGALTEPGLDCGFLDGELQNIQGRKHSGKEDGTEGCGPLAETEAGHAVSACACGTLGGVCDRSVEMLLAAIVNNLAVWGAETKSVMLSVLFPTDQDEKELKRMMEQAGAWCAARRIRVAGGHSEVSRAVSRPMLTVTGFGNAPRQERGEARLRPGQALVMTGWAGMAGTAILAKNRERKLLTRYPYSIIDAARGLEEQILVTEAAREGRAFCMPVMHDVSQGGVFGALWEMAQQGGVGLEVDLKKIPIRQETVEICEFFDLNPYQLYGQGALLIATSRGEALAEHLNGRGILAVVIGHTTDGNARILRNGEEVRYLERPVQDALWALEERAAE